MFPSSPCPYTKTASLISKAPSSTLWKSISPQQTAASTSKTPQGAAEEGDGHSSVGLGCKVGPGPPSALPGGKEQHPSVPTAQAGDMAQSKAKNAWTFIHTAKSIGL